MSPLKTLIRKITAKSKCLLSLYPSSCLLRAWYFHWEPGKCKNLSYCHNRKNQKKLLALGAFLFFFFSFLLHKENDKISPQEREEVRNLRVERYEDKCQRFIRNQCQENKLEKNSGGKAIEPFQKAPGKWKNPSSVIHIRSRDTSLNQFLRNSLGIKLCQSLHRQLHWCNEDSFREMRMRDIADR